MGTCVVLHVFSKASSKDTVSLLPDFYYRVFTTCLYSQTNKYTHLRRALVQRARSKCVYECCVRSGLFTYTKSLSTPGSYRSRARRACICVYICMLVYSLCKKKKGLITPGSCRSRERHACVGTASQTAPAACGVLTPLCMHGGPSSFSRPGR